MNKHEQTWTSTYIYDKVWVYTVVYEGNIPAAMISLCTGARDLYSGRGPLSYPWLCKQIFTKGLGTYTYMEAHDIFGKIWRNLHFCFVFFGVLMIEIYTKGVQWNTEFHVLEWDLYLCGSPCFISIKHGWLFFWSFEIDLKKGLKSFCLRSFENGFCFEKTVQKEKEVGLTLSNIREAPLRFENQLINRKDLINSFFWKSKRNGLSFWKELRSLVLKRFEFDKSQLN